MLPLTEDTQVTSTEEYEKLIGDLQRQTLSVAKRLGDRIESDMMGSRSAEIPAELIKLWGPLIDAADQLNGISIASAINRLTALGYKVTED